MKRTHCVVTLVFAIVFSSSAFGQSYNRHIAQAKCSNYEYLVKNNILRQFIPQNVPIRVAQNMWDGLSESYRLERYLRGITREMYANPELAKRYVSSGTFMEHCISEAMGS